MYICIHVNFGYLYFVLNGTPKTTLYGIMADHDACISNLFLFYLPEAVNFFIYIHKTHSLAQPEYFFPEHVGTNFLSNLYICEKKEPHSLA